MEIQFVFCKKTQENVSTSCHPIYWYFQLETGKKDVFLTHTVDDFFLSGSTNIQTDNHGVICETVFNSVLADF